MNTQILCLSSDLFKKNPSHRSSLLHFLPPIGNPICPHALWRATPSDHHANPSAGQNVPLMWNNRTLHPHHSCAIHEFTHPSPRHPFLLGTENESETVSADYRGSFSRFSSSLLREKKKFRSISLSPSLPSRSYRWKGKEGREVARNWLSNVGLMTGCRARLCVYWNFVEDRDTTVFSFFFFGDSQRFSRNQNRREIQKYS